MVGIILWTFELRELTLQVFEVNLGARLHANFGVKDFGIASLDSGVLFEFSSSLLDLLTIFSSSVRINLGRFSGNYFAS